MGYWHHLYGIINSGSWAGSYTQFICIINTIKRASVIYGVFLFVCSVPRIKFRLYIFQVTTLGFNNTFSCLVLVVSQWGFQSKLVNAVGLTGLFENVNVKDSFTVDTLQRRKHHFQQSWMPGRFLVSRMIGKRRVKQRDKRNQTWLASYSGQVLAVRLDRSQVIEDLT